MQQNNEETTSPQKGTIVTTPGDNTNAAQDSAVFNNNGDHESSSDDRPEHQPGFMPGPDYTGTGIFTGYTSDQDVHGNIEEGGVILEGFLPEDDPSRRRRRSHDARAQSKRERIQRLSNAVTLDDSAVKPIPIEEDGDEEGNTMEVVPRSNGSEDDDDEEDKSDNHRWLLPLGMLVSCVYYAGNYSATKFAGEVGKCSSRYDSFWCCLSAG